MASFALHHYGRSLGIDAIIVARVKEFRTSFAQYIVGEVT